MRTIKMYPAESSKCQSRSSQHPRSCICLNCPHSQRSSTKSMNWSISSCHTYFLLSFDLFFSLILFRSSGVFGKMEKVAFGGGQAAVEDEFAPIEILPLWPAMCLGLAGIIAAVVFFLCELLVQRRSNR